MFLPGELKNSISTMPRPATARNAGEPIVKPGITHASLSIARPDAIQHERISRNHPSVLNACRRPNSRVVMHMFISRPSNICTTPNASAMEKKSCWKLRKWKPSNIGASDIERPKKELE